MFNCLLLAAALVSQGDAAISDHKPDPILAQAATRVDPPLVAPDGDPKHLAQMKHDDEMGRKYALEVAREYKASDNKEYVARVERIGAEIAAIARRTPAVALWGDKRLSPFNYHYYVIKGKDVNAFSLPGGNVYVFEGLVKYVESDDELAGVLGHETAHAAFRHISTLQHEQTKLQRITLPLILLSVLAGGASGGIEALEADQLVGLAKGSGWSLQAELAADYGGFQYLAHTHYNPTGMLTLMERFAKDERNAPNIPLGIFESHPPSRERAQALMGYMARAHIPIQRSAVSTSLRAIAKPGDKDAVEIWFAGQKMYAFAGKDAQTRATEAIPRLNAFFDGTPELYEVQLDGDRIVYRRQTLFEVTPDDAAAAGMTVDDLAAEALKSVQGSLYVLAFRVWDEK